MTTTQTILLNQTQWKIPAVVHAVQGDTGRSLKMIIEDEVIPSGSTANLSIWRSDDTHYVIENCTFSISDNSFTVNITQALTQAGITKCQLKVSGIVSAYLFMINVQESADGTPTEQEGWDIADAIQAANEALTEAQNAVALIESLEAGVILDFEDDTIVVGILGDGGN